MKSSSGNDPALGDGCLLQHVLQPTLICVLPQTQTGRACRLADDLSDFRLVGGNSSKAAETVLQFRIIRGFRCTGEKNRRGLSRFTQMRPLPVNNISRGSHECVAVGRFRLRREQFLHLIHGDQQARLLCSRGREGAAA